MSESAPVNMSLPQQLASFPRAFWVANCMEMIERLAFFGVRAIGALYIVAAAEQGGLGFSNTDKGVFFAVWAFIQCLLPMFTGGFSDRYGYRLSLVIAFTINITGYAMMAYCHSWGLFMLACCLIGTGTAIFKPPLHGTIAHCVTESNSSVGWGMFYMVVNIGGFVGPIFAGALRLIEWRYAFLLSAAVMSLNYIPTLFLLKDYSKEVDRDKSKGMGQVLKETFQTLADAKFMVFLAIFSGFWLMFMQLFDSLPVYIDQWVNSSDIIATAASVTGNETLAGLVDQGTQVNPEWIVNVDAGSIVLLVLLITYISGKFAPVKAMIVGMIIACVGLIMAGTATSGWPCVLGIFIFAIGEMACSPKFSEYVGLMATPEKKALYMGYSNIPFAVGWGVGNLASGISYDRFSDKFELAKHHLIQVLHMPAAEIEALKKTEIMPALAEKLAVDVSTAQDMLRQTYHPEYFWWVLAGLGFLCTLGMVGYHFWLKADAKRRAALA
ncbi:MAG: MFS transporter [Planctomycetes bacterium]|nr:MFS transporter [Planctomycetota bacterium]